MFILGTLLVFNFAILTIFVGYHFLFLILFAHYRLTTPPKRCAEASGPLLRIAIVVPAHNEEAIIDRLLDSIVALDYPLDYFELFVVADNCTDETQNIVTARGFKCYPRTDRVKIGKPYALEWIFQQIDLDRFDVFTIVDADTILDRHYLQALSAKFQGGAEVVQGYFGIMNPDETWLTRLSVIPGMLKFNIRYFMKDKLGISCPLMGNGMGFAAHIIRRYGWNAFSITENWEYYIKLTLQGHVVRYAPDAVIFSHAVRVLSHGETQRTRWFKGRLGILGNYFWPLFINGLAPLKPNHIDALIELASPSYSMLFCWSLASFTGVVIPLAAGLPTGGWTIWASLLVVMQVVLFVAGLVISKAPLKTWLQLTYVPVFLIWKIVVTAKGLVTFGDKNWKKTDRKLD